MSRGKFIVFDGIDGTGKGTIKKMVLAKLTELDVPHVTIHQPGGTWFGDRIRETIFNREHNRNLEPDALELALIANQIQNTEEVIRPNLEAGRHVIGDRYWQSHMAYMLGRAAHDPRTNASRPVIELSWEITGIDPDLFLLFTCDAGKALERAGKREGSEGSKQDDKPWGRDAALQATIQTYFTGLFGHRKYTKIVETDHGDIDKTFAETWALVSEVIK